MTKMFGIVALVAVSIGLSSCGQSAEGPTVEASGPAAPNEAKSGKAAGTVTVVDATAGTITLDHGAIPALGWPPMKMGFSAKPDLLVGISVGDKVDFDVTVTGSGGQINSIQKQ